MHQRTSLPLGESLVEALIVFSIYLFLYLNLIHDMNVFIFILTMTTITCSINVEQDYLFGLNITIVICNK